MTQNEILYSFELALNCVSFLFSMWETVLETYAQYIKSITDALLRRSIPTISCAVRIVLMDHDCSDLKSSGSLMKVSKASINLFCGPNTGEPKVFGYRKKIIHTN